MRRPAVAGLFHWTLLAFILAVSPGAHAQQSARKVTDDLWTLPANTAAWFAFDPGLLGERAGEDRTRALIEAGIRTLISNIATVEGGGSRVVGGMLKPETLGATPYRVCLMSFGASTLGDRIEPDRPIAIEKLAVVVEVRTAENHQKFVDLIRAALTEEKPGRTIGAGTEVAADFTGGVKGSAFSREGEGDPRRVEWCSTPKSFIVGVGKGSVDRWLAAMQPKGTDEAEWYLHRKMVADGRGKSDPAFEAFVSLDQLRLGAPEEFAYGRMGRLAAAWHLSNGRALMVHGRTARKSAGKPGESAATAPPLLLVNVTYSMRSENPGVLHNLPVSESVWPGAGDVPWPAGSVNSMLVRANFEEWVGLSLNTYAALSPKAGAEATAARTRWMRAHLAALERIKSRVGRWAVVNAGEDGRAAVAVALLGPTATSGGKDRLDQDLREVCGTISDSIKFDTSGKVWTLQADGCTFSWGLAPDGQSMIGAWSAETLKKK